MVSLVHMTGSEGPIILAVVPERTTLLFELRLRWNKVNLSVSDRSHRCMLNTIDGPSESVEDYLCDPEEMPLGARESRLPCPEDCVLNDWGPWGRCSLVRAHITQQPRQGHRAVLSPQRSILISSSWQKYFFSVEAEQSQTVWREQCMNLCQQVISRTTKKE